MKSFTLDTVPQFHNGKTRPFHKKENFDDAQSNNRYVEELKQIYWSEQSLIIAIPIMIQNATTDDLATALRTHLEFTRNHIQRLEALFESIGKLDYIVH
ncbi:MAG: DUF892 family protein [Burkholderiales bacterium]|nr:DUF892 family protein [Flavobacterium sp.]